jgi:cytochrome c1
MLDDTPPDRPNRDVIRKGLRRPNHCCYCKRHFLRGPENTTSDNAAIRGQCESAEHVIPQSKGGTNHSDNLTLACQRCNSMRGSIDHRIFTMFAQHILVKHPDAHTWILREALHQFIVDLAEIAIRNTREARSAISKTAHRFELRMKDPDARIRR